MNKKQIIKRLLVYACVTFTILTIYDIFNKLTGEGIGSTIDTIDIMTRFLLCTVAFMTMLIFEYLEHWPLRFVQIIHYLLSVSIVTVLILIISYYDQTLVFNNRIWGYIKSYSIVYLVILIIYEIRLRKNIEIYNKILKKDK